ncbi:ricin B lectin domain-containing protein [Chytriomyces sp. MP71]|nr:ricin B lectin domain-containing protein [Chytriomyces sp. MP71]
MTQDRGFISDTWGNMGHLERFGAEAAVAGVAYLGYEEWRKHHNKPLNSQSEAEHAAYTNGYKQQGGNVITNTWNNMSHLERFGAEAAIVGTAYVGYEEWKKHNNKTHSQQSQAEHMAYMQNYAQSRSAAHQIAPNMRVAIQNPQTGKVLDISGASSHNGAKAILYENNGGANQRFYYDQGLLRSAMDPNKVLDVEGANFQDGTSVILWDFNGGVNQRWILENDGTIRSAGNPVFALDFDEGGRRLNIWRFHGNWNQQFRVVQA